MCSKLIQRLDTANRQMQAQVDEMQEATNMALSRLEDSKHKQTQRNKIADPKF